ncbi:MAG: T9SS type A sorting domain-containing protein [Candidatus Cloacimonetes bacterium]|nr:T9SS type A sorting domain-containing protein [Candidatus Cloacimonadota bacterium]MBL7149413.1 T9SS type A sorting domain-containing protein [Candidatus Cloacimonadota bacterium]
MKSCKYLITFTLLTYSIICYSYNIEQAIRFSDKYSSRSEGSTIGIGDPYWHNISKFIYREELPTAGPYYAGYIDGDDCAHFVSQCLEAGGIPISEDYLGDDDYLYFFINTDPMHTYFTNQGISIEYISTEWTTEDIWPNIESLHPYLNYTYEWWPFYAPDEAGEIELHFVRFETEYGYDYVSITDDYEIISYSGNWGYNFWEGPFCGSYLDIVFESDYSNTDWGFQIDQYRWRTNQEPPYDFEEGDVMITGDSTDPHFHAIFCRDDFDPTYTWTCNAHSTDCYDKDWDFFYGSATYSRCEFYGVSGLWDEVPDLCWDDYMLEDPIIVTDNQSDLTQHYYSDFEYGETVYIFYSFTNDGWIMLPDNFEVSIYVNDDLIATHQYDGMLAGDIYVSTQEREELVTFTWLCEDTTIEIKLDSGNGSNWFEEQNWDEWDEYNNEEILIISSTGNSCNVPDVIFSLNQNHPNPFNPATIISYSLAENIHNPKIEIYNVKGQKVKSFQLEEKAGENSIVWNGKDENDKSVSSSVYFYRLVNEGKTIKNKKMLLIK